MHGYLEWLSRRTESDTYQILAHGSADWPAWSQEAYLTAHVIDGINTLVWAKTDTERNDAPEPIPRPGPKELPPSASFDELLEFFGPTGVVQ